MNSLQRSTGLTMIAVPLLFMAAFTGLQMSFDYPDILRQPPPDVLARFQLGGPALLATWYIFMLSALAFIPVGVLSGLWLWPRNQTAAAFAATFGVLAGLVQALGLLRWVVLVPNLAAAPAGDPTTEAVFNAFHLYAGVGIGEHFGYLFTALWTVSVALTFSRKIPAVAVIGILLALGILAGMLEPFGIVIAGTINAIAYTAWAAWLIALGVIILRAPATINTSKLQPA